MKRLYLPLAAAGAFALGWVGTSRCSAPTVPPAPPPATPAATSAATSSTVATTEFEFEAIIPPRRVAQNPYTVVQASPLGSQTQQQRGDQVDKNSPGPYSAVQDEPIIIRIRQTATAAASSEASASLSQPSTVESSANSEQTHARLGTMVATVPGALALSYQLARVDVPPWVAGVPLELGLEVEGNLAQVGAGLSVGGKAFATAGGYAGWAGPGWYVGVGMRF